MHWHSQDLLVVCAIKSNECCIAAFNTHAQATLHNQLNHHHVVRLAIMMPSDRKLLSHLASTLMLCCRMTVMAALNFIIIFIYYAEVAKKYIKNIQEGWLPPTKRASAAKIN